MGFKNIDKYDKNISVEASKNTFDKLVRNISNNNKILPLNFDVCDSTDEFIKFYDCESNVLSTINENWLNGGVSRFNVKYKETFSKTIRINKLIELYDIPNLIKIDVENAEYQCVKSMTNKYNMLCFEWTSEFVDIVFTPFLI